MAKTPPIPKEQQSFRGERAEITGKDVPQRDREPGVQHAQPGDADVNTEEQGRFGNIHQNITNQGHQQDR